VGRGSSVRWPGRSPSCPGRTTSAACSRERCPLLFPTPTGGVCGVNHEQFQKGIGCVKYKNLSVGAHMRIALDRKSPEYETISDQRTATERINSQAVALGIERPKVRNPMSDLPRQTLKPSFTRTS